METKNLNDIYQKLLELEHNMVTKEEMISYIDTIEIISNEETMS